MQNLANVLKPFLKNLLREMSEDYVFSGAAALGYFLTLAIFPALIFLLTLIPFLPIPDVDKALMALVNQALPGEAASLLTGVVEEVTSHRRGGLLSFGAVGTLWAASTGTYAVMQQLNIAYGVRERRTYLKTRLTALKLTLLLGVLFTVAFLLTVLGGALQEWAARFVGWDQGVLYFFSGVRWVIIVTALLSAFAVTYHFGPNIKRKFRFLTPGSVVGAPLLILTSLGIRYYTENFANYGATYGSLGAVIALMLWLYTSGLVILTGAEINALTEDPVRR